jgi:two-component system chemotaxis response regulator CheY
MELFRFLDLQKVLSFMSGATMSCKVPAERNTQEDVAASPPALQKTDVPTVMVIDDDDITRELVTCAMGDHGRVVEVSDGRGIIDIYQHVKPDVVFLDINMPILDGWKILGDILRIDPEANVVMLSGNGTYKNVMNARDSGAKSFVSKPFNVGTIQNRVLHCMEVRG